MSRYDHRNTPRQSAPEPLAPPKPPEPVAPPPDLTISLVVERRNGRNGDVATEWSATLAKPNGTVQRVDWKARHLFLADYAVLHQEYVRLVMDGTGRPMIG